MYALAFPHARCHFKLELLTLLLVTDIYKRQCEQLIRLGLQCMQEGMILRGRRHRFGGLKLIGNAGTCGFALKGLVGGEISL